mgnify:CR=1 FL=1
MCGILGTIPITDYNVFRHALDTLEHRGPDDFGIEIVNNEIVILVMAVTTMILRRKISAADAGRLANSRLSHSLCLLKLPAAASDRLVRPHSCDPRGISSPELLSSGGMVVPEAAASREIDP